MARDFAITLGGDRGDEWERAVGTRKFHIKTPIPATVLLEGLGEREVFLLDAEATPDELIGRIADHMSAKTGASRDEVLCEILARGLPIIADECTVVVANPQRWF